MDAMAFWLLFWAAVGSIGGAAMGRTFRGRPRAGLFLGLILGPLLGWPLLTFLADHRRRCGDCRGLVQAEANKYEHCGAELNAAPRVEKTEPSEEPAKTTEDPSFVTGIVRWVSDATDETGYAAVIETNTRFAFLGRLSADEALKAKSRLGDTMTFDRLNVRAMLPDLPNARAEIRRFIGDSK